LVTIAQRLTVELSHWCTDLGNKVRKEQKWAEP
jgi:hypothetical protein